MPYNDYYKYDLKKSSKVLTFFYQLKVTAWKYYIINNTNISK